jgi:hypothetical protein
MEPGFRPCPYCAEPIREEAKICRFCNRDVQSGNLSRPEVVASNTRTLVPSTPRHAAARFIWKFVYWTVVVLGVVFLAAYFWGRSSSNSTTGFHLTRPVSITVRTGQFLVKAGQYSYSKVTVTSKMLNAHLVGSFQASGGMGNDIQVVVADGMEFQNWVNGHPARLLFSTQKVTAGRMDVPLAPGTYILAFNNGFSLVSDKRVAADIELQFF